MNAMALQLNDFCQPRAQSQADRPHQLFADAPPPPSAPNPVVSSLGSGLPPPGTACSSVYASEALGREGQEAEEALEE